MAKTEVISTPARPTPTQTTKRTARNAIRVYCGECQGNSQTAIEECKALSCPLHAFRKGDSAPKVQKPLLQACKTYCLNYCQAGEGREEVKNCQGDKAFLGSCPLFPFRFGRNPNYAPTTRAKRSQNVPTRTDKGTFSSSKTSAPASI